MICDFDRVRDVPIHIGIFYALIHGDCLFHCHITSVAVSYIGCTDVLHISKQRCQYIKTDEHVKAMQTE